MRDTAVTTEPALAVDGLTVGFQTDTSYVRMIEDVSFSLASGCTIGLVGESGSGKSVTAQAIMRLLPMPPARIESGKVRLAGEDIACLPEREMRRRRGDRIAMIFQEPMTSLNPTIRVGPQIAESLTLHGSIKGAEARTRVLEMLEAVGIGAGERRYQQYPHELSGGLRQRIMIAMALICHPAVLIADEPTTALDSTIQAQILDLLGRLQRETGLAILLITHDLGVVGELAHDVAVIYAGRIVERGPRALVLGTPRHPYTAALLAAAPALRKKGERLAAIPGMVPAPGKRGPGCSFADRCARVQPHCLGERPPLADIGNGSQLACWYPVR
jgi:oligopeptide/dipeptide ABC transporter ATP-binding protein